MQFSDDNSELESVTDDDIDTDGAFAVPAYVTAIAEFAFEGCSSLRSVVLPAGVMTIDALAFHGCANLETVSISGSDEAEAARVEALLPETVRQAFTGCSRITSVTLPGDATGNDGDDSANESGSIPRQ